MVQKHKLKGNFNLLIVPHIYIFLLVSRTHLLILILTSNFLAQNVTIIRKKMAQIQSSRGVIIAESDFLLLYLYMPCLVTRHVRSSLFVDKVSGYWNMPSVLWRPSQTLCIRGVPKMYSWN